jgi:hypothetical protein
MRRTTILMLASVVVLAGGVAAAPAAAAKDGDVELRGACSASSTYVAKARPRDGGRRIEFYVKNNTVGQSWTYTLTQGGTVVLTSTKKTRATDDTNSSSDDSRHTAEVKWRTTTGSTSGALVMKAVNAKTGEVCSATA